MPALLKSRCEHPVAGGDSNKFVFPVALRVSRIGGLRQMSWIVQQGSGAR